MEYLFVFEYDIRCWSLKITNIELLNQYFNDNQVFEHDKAHYKELQTYEKDDYRKATHSEYGWYINNALKNNISIDDAYNILAGIQYAAMYKVLQETGAIYISEIGSFHGERKEKNYNTFIHKNTLDFPKYYNEDIRIKQFPDGTHYYAYIGNIQVKDKTGILKWNSYDEAYQAALEYSRNYRHKLKYHSN